MGWRTEAGIHDSEKDIVVTQLTIDHVLGINSQCRVGVFFLEQGLKKKSFLASMETIELVDNLNNHSPLLGGVRRRGDEYLQEGACILGHRVRPIVRQSATSSARKRSANRLLGGSA